MGKKVKKTKSQRVKETKSQRDGGVLTTTETTRGNSFASLTHRERGFLKVNGGKGAAKRAKRAKRQRDKETKSQRVKETKRQRVKETKSQRDKESKSQRDKETGAVAF